MIDRTTKILLALIALGLWFNAGVNVVSPARADPGDFLRFIYDELLHISQGTCDNKKIC